MLIYTPLGKQTNYLCFHTTFNMPATGIEALSKGLVLNTSFLYTLVSWGMDTY